MNFMRFFFEKDTKINTHKIHAKTYDFDFFFDKYHELTFNTLLMRKCISNVNLLFHANIVQIS